MLIIVHVYVCVKLFTFFDLYFVYFLQYSDTVGWFFWPVKTVGRITYIVLAQTLNHAQPLRILMKLLAFIAAWPYVMYTITGSVEIKRLIN